jgi:hypothetical protein
MLPSDGGICRQATGRRQANHMYFESRFYCGIQSEHGTKSTTNYSYKLIMAFKVVPKIVYGSLPMMGKVADNINST